MTLWISYISIEFFQNFIYIFRYALYLLHKSIIIAGSRAFSSGTLRAEVGGSPEVRSLRSA